MQRLALAERLRRVQHAPETRPSALDVGRENAVVEEARDPVRALIQLDQQRGIARQVDLLQVDVGRSSEAGHHRIRATLLERPFGATSEYEPSAPRSIFTVSPVLSLTFDPA